MTTIDLNEIQRRRQLYYNLMQEVRHRIDSITLIESQLGGALNTLPHYLATEYYLLQFRMIFESIALGCMVVHGDVPTAKNGTMTKSYQADLLLKALSKAKFEFFLTPVYYLIQAQNSQAIHVGPPLEGGFLTKEEIIKLYGKYGEYLHRGKIKTLQAKQQDAMAPLTKEIGAVIQKLMALLLNHTINLRDADFFLACSMAPDGVEVHYLSRQALPKHHPK